ncbi:hypothetical protein [Aerosakkonema funiforme]|uniref:hypothetical protein n=1 Tax=Aerosakkonema funiforme TaxID=1246630 RepID=UPI0035B6BFEA
MKLQFFNKKISDAIKVISTVLIIGAIALEIWHIYAILTNIEIPTSLNPIFLLERFAVVAHLIEGVIAAFYAPSKNKMPLEYGIYTFFVGTVGLLELFDKFEKAD